MKNIILTLYSLILFTSFFSCSPSLTPITSELIKDNRWNEDDLKKIQFYNSGDIILTRRLNSGESSIKGGKIIVRNGERIEEVVIKNGTPGVLLFMPKEDRYAISFDNDSNEKYLIFGPNPKMSSRIVLLGKEWDYRVGKVSYNGQIYNTTTDAAFSALLINLKKASQVTRHTEIAKGRKVDQ